MKRRSLIGAAAVLFLGLAVLAPGVLAQSAPALSLKAAVEAAEKALADMELAADRYFLYSVVLQNDAAGDYWKCTFRPVEAGNRGGYGQIYVKVYMSASAEVVMPDVPLRYR